jgi:hypothetical protein
LNEDVEKKLSMGKTNKNFMKENIKNSNSPRARERSQSPTRDNSPPKESQRTQK